MSTFHPLVPETASPGDHTATFLKHWTTGVLLSAIAYGVTLTLSISTLSLLHTSSRNRKEKKHYTLITYVILMLFLATVSIASGIRSNLNAIYNLEIPANLNVGRNENAIIVVLVIWCSDGFLLWRAAVLYEGITVIKRIIMWALIGILMLAQIATGILYISYNFIPALSSNKYSEPIFLAFGTATLAVNWFITGLIVLRVGEYGRRVSTTLGKSYGRPFKKVIVVCIESAALIIIFSTILLVNNLQGKSPFSLSRLLLVQIYIIAPLLILNRVTQDQMPAPDSNQSPLLHRRHPSALRFHDSGALPTSILGENSNWSKTVEVQISRDVHKTPTDGDGDDLEMDSDRQKDVTPA